MSREFKFRCLCRSGQFASGAGYREGESISAGAHHIVQLDPVLKAECIKLFFSCIAIFLTYIAKRVLAYAAGLQTQSDRVLY